MTSDAAIRWTYTASEVADRIGISAQTVREMCRSGRIRTVPFGRLRLIPVSEVQRILGEPVPGHEMPDTGRAEREENERLRRELRRLRDELDKLIGDEE